MTPIYGQAGANLVDPGIWAVRRPTLLTTVTRVQPIFVYFDAPESLVLELLELKRRGRSRRPVWQGSGRHRRGRGFSPRGEDRLHRQHGGPRDRHHRDAGGAANPESLLFPGLFVRERCWRSNEDAVLVDERAVGTDLGGKYVLVVGDENMVEQRYVTLAPCRMMAWWWWRMASRARDVHRQRPAACPAGFPVTPLTEEEGSASRDGEAMLQARRVEGS